MADRNSYLAYKRDTRHLLYWMIHAYNIIVKSSPPLLISGDSPAAVNTTGQIKVSAFVPVSKLIAEHIKSVPSVIYRLFRSVIAARSSAHAVFQQVVANKPDPEIEKSNVSHKCFIDALTDAFKVLGGDEWASKQKLETEDINEEEIEQIIFANKFSTLGLDESDDEEEEEDNAGKGGPDGSPATVQKPRSRKKPSGKGKKGKRGSKAKGKPKQTAKKPDLDKVPLESYRIIEDDDGIITDYLMAVYYFFQEAIELRQSVQQFWYEVAYAGLNTAVAGTLSNITIAMVKQTELSIFIDFPGHDSYETLMNTITRGNPDKAQGMFHMELTCSNPSLGIRPQKVKAIDIDIKEQFFIHAYWDLRDFIEDFQKTRSGKPTKPMLSEIRDWDPEFNLQRATKEQRIKWRRSYTISWLYDLVNVFSSIVVQRNTMKGQGIVLETVDWSVSGPWDEHRRLYGLNEFAGEVTSLAMQKPGTDIRPKILPHLVFQMQCIVDSLTASRGWMLNCFQGHVLTPPAEGFRPRRDVDLFLDRTSKRFPRGYCQSVHILSQIFEKDDIHSRNPVGEIELLRDNRDDFVNWLGESKYSHKLKTIPPSRFTNSNSNGLWEYSPFLNGVGLMEALELAYGFNFMFWERITEPMCLVHLHNMLVQTGHLSKPVGIFASLQELFSESFFVDGKAPKSDFEKALTEMIDGTNSRRAARSRRTAARAAIGVHDILDVNLNWFYKRKSLLRIYREAGWLPHRIPDEEVRPSSLLGNLRMALTKQETDPDTGKRVFQETPIIKRARASGVSDESIANMSKSMHQIIYPPQIPEEFLGEVREGYKSAMPTSKGASGAGYSNSEILRLLKIDIFNDVSGEMGPLSSLNYASVTVHMMMVFSLIEGELKKRRNPLWLSAYEQDRNLMRHKRPSLTGLALAQEDDECLRVMAEIFDRTRVGFIGLIYWDDVEGMEDMIDRTSKANPDTLGAGLVPDACTVM